MRRTRQRKAGEGRGLLPCIARLIDLAKLSGVVVFVALTQSGCVTSGNRAELPPLPPSEEIRAQVGTIGVVAAGALTNLALHMTPGLGMGASTGAGAGVGSLYGFALGASVPPAVIITVPLGTIVGAIAGAVDGNAEGKSAQLAKAQQEQLRKITPLTNLQETVSRELFRVVQRKTHHRVVFIPESQHARIGGEADHPSQATNAVDTLIVVNIVDAGLIAHLDKDSLPLVAFMAVAIRLIRVSDGTELYSRTWFYRGGAGEFADWTQRDDLALRQELAGLAPQLAESVAEELFLVYEPPRGKSGK